MKKEKKKKKSSSTLIKCSRPSGILQVLRTSILNAQSQPQRPRHLYLLRYASFMIPDLVYTSRDLYASNQVRSRPTCSSLGLGTTSRHARGFCHLVNALTFTEPTIGPAAFDKADVRIRKKS